MEATAAIGLRFYNKGYLEDLSKAKVTAAGYPWMLAKPMVLPAIEDLFEQGVLITRVLDDNNWNVIQSSWLDSNGLDLSLLLLWDETARTVKVSKADSPNNKLRVLTPEGAQKVMMNYLRMKNPKIDQNEQAKGAITSIVNEFYQGRMAVVAIDPANLIAVHGVLNAHYEWDLKINLK